MTIRSRSENLTFRNRFVLRGVDRPLLPGSYHVVTEEETIEELSFPVYRRISTTLHIPLTAMSEGSFEAIPVDPSDLAAAHESDRSKPTGGP